MLNAQDAYIVGPSRPSLGDVDTYYLIDANDQVDTDSIQWDSDGVVQGTNTETTVNILWDYDSTNMIEACYTNELGENFCATLEVNVLVPSLPMPEITYYSGYTRLTRSNPPSGEIWYWQSTLEGTSTSNSSQYIDRYSGTVYYLRSYNTLTSQWNTANRTINYTINPSHSLSDENYIYTITPKIKTTSISTLSDDDKLENVAYFDGLGRSMQNIGIRAGANQEDIISHIGYDEFGRQSKDYLPYATTSNGGMIRRGELTTITNQFYQTKYSSDFTGVSLSDVNAYSQKVFDNSPLNRVLEQAAPGKDWKVGNGHTIQFDYQTNITNEVLNFGV
jgi:hypothetical protein